MVNLNMSKYSIVTMEEVQSTNDYALENISYLDDATVIFTTNQTSGRGRYNRKWVCDNSDNIYMSLILKPKDIKNYPYANLTQYLSVVLCKLLEKEFNLEPSIKWPNDILVDGGKISGILAESYMKNNQIEGIVLGLGLNVNMKAETLSKIDQKAVSLFALTGKTYNAETVLTMLLDSFFENYNNFETQGFKYIKDDYIKRCTFLGKTVLISENNTKKQYIAQAIDEEGLLTVKDDKNNEYKIITGDVLC